MTRAKKAVVDYFPHYCNHGKTMFTIEQKYGNDGYSFWFKLLEILGKSENHFYDFNNPAEWEYLLAIVRMSEESVLSILADLVKLGAIDKELYEMKIIWSENFVKNLTDLYSRRESDPYKKPAIQDYYTQKYPLSGNDVDIYPQSKVKETILEETILKENKTIISIPQKKSAGVPTAITNDIGLPAEQYKECRLWFEYLYAGWVKRSNRLNAWREFTKIYKAVSDDKRERLFCLMGWTNYKYREMYSAKTIEAYKMPNYDKHLKEAKYLDCEDTFTPDNHDRVLRMFKKFVDENGAKYE